ncbi:hypothetical protein LJC56_05890 [Christensenellaceae bacterium OttesenSCG-928-K19]|nr:hypothetical protein [Christensenellaceae bacterium OttesenSCG-928-K19]
MNAIPQKTHNYKRIEIPNTPAAQRTRPLARIESLDVRRAAKLAAVKKQKQAKVQDQRTYDQGRYYDDVEMYYNMRRQDSDGIRRYEERREEYYQQQVLRETQPRKKKPVKKQAVQKKSRGRKLTAAYEVTPRRNYYGKHVGSGYQVNADGTLVQRPGIPGFDMNAAGPAAEAYGRHVAVEYEAPKKKGVFSTILCIALVFVMLAGVLVKYSDVSEVTYSNSQADARIVALQEEIDKLEVEISLNQDLNNVQQRAAELGMSHPGEGQVVYLPAGTFNAEDMYTEDTATVAGEAVEDTVAETQTTSTVTDADSGQVVSGDGGEGQNASEEGFMDKIGSFFGSIADTISRWLA